jgi:hypothetical protein
LLTSLHFSHSLELEPTSVSFAEREGQLLANESYLPRSMFLMLLVRENEIGNSPFP